MRGTFFQKPIEFNLHIDGESWVQGDLVRGTLTIKNHGTETIALSSYGVTLSFGNFRKVKSKAERAFVTRSSILFKSGLELPAQGEKDLIWEFELEENSPITDRLGSYYIIYGENQGARENNHLQLKVEIRPILQTYLDIFENFLRFKIKEKKNKNKNKAGEVDVKVIPPKSKEFTSLDGLNCLMKMDGENIQIKYLFKVKNLDYVDGNAVMCKKNVEFDQTLLPQEYQFGEGSPNQDGIIKAIEGILKQVKLKSFF